MAHSNLTVRDTGGIQHVRFQNAAMLDSTTIDKLSGELFKLVETGEPQRVVLDFQDVSFLASRAIGVLVTMRQKAEQSGSMIVLSRVPPPIAKLFELTNMTAMFKTFESNEKAFDFFHHANLKSYFSGVRKSMKPEKN